ncbi:MAG TPA: DapH/DapD/GlmU-related protein [Dehalococcoidia bacterium]|nr:DapH/DapD/GlmU-related protein [Dehalococcoidia bacterium]
MEPLISQLKANLEERLEVCARLIQKGVAILDPATTYIDPQAEVSEGSEILPNTSIHGKSRIGKGCEIGPNTIIRDSTIASGCRVLASVIEGSVLEDGVDVGPFSHLRPGAYLEAGVHIGNFVEVKQARLGRGTKVGHFSYIGDATVGREVNIGAGTITCNYDGQDKHQTTIEDGAFIGSDTMLIAPVRVGKKGRTGAGAVVTRDVPEGALVVGMPARRTRAIPTKGKSGARRTNSG